MTDVARPAPGLLDGLGRQEAAALLDLLVTRCPVIVYVLDAAGVCTYSVGPPLARLGLGPNELVGVDVVARNAHDPVAASHMRRALAGEACSYTWTGAEEATRFEAWLQPVLDADGAVTAVVGVSVDVSDAWRAEASEHARVLEQQDVLHQLLAVQDAERERISAGLHDDTVQVLAALALRVSTLRRRLPGAEPSVVAELSAMSRDLSEAGTRLRDVVAGLQPEVLVRAGLSHALQELLTRSCGPDGPAPRLDLGAGEPSEAARRVLYEVAVEAVGNVVKHAAATELVVSVRREGSDWVLEVVDDGTGTEVDERTSDGFGLRAMRQRAVAAGGALELDSVPGRGTTVRLRVPDVATFPTPGHAAAVDVRGPLEHILQNVSDAFVALDTSWRYVYVNRRAAELFGTTPDQLVGQEIWALYPEGAETDFHRAYLQAVQEQRTIEIEEWFEPAGRWYRNRILPSPGGLTVFIEDVTERRRLASLQDDTDVGSLVAHTWFVALAGDRDPVRAVRAGAEALVARGVVTGLRVSGPGIEVAVGEHDAVADVLPATVGGEVVAQLAVSWSGGSTPWSGELAVMLAQALAARLAPGPPAATGGDGERSS